MQGGSGLIPGAMEDQGPVSMDYLLEQVMHKDLGRRLQVGQEIAELLMSEDRCPDLDQDQAALDRLVDSVASSWVNSSNFKVRVHSGSQAGSPGLPRSTFGETSG